MVLGVNGERALGFHCISISQVRIGLGDYHGRVHRGSHRCAAAAGGTDDVARHAGQCRWILGIGVDARDGAADVMGSVYGNGALGLGDFLDGTLVIIGDGALDEVRIAAGVGLGGSGDVIQIRSACDAGPGAAGALDGDIANGLGIFRRNRNRAVFAVFRGV